MSNIMDDKLSLKELTNNKYMYQLVVNRHVCYILKNKNNEREWLLYEYSFDGIEYPVLKIEEIFFNDNNKVLETYIDGKQTKLTEDKVYVKEEDQYKLVTGVKVEIIYLYNK